MASPGGVQSARSATEGWQGAPDEQWMRIMRRPARSGSGGQGWPVLVDAEAMSTPSDGWAGAL
jgi:hypothetical protein